MKYTSSQLAIIIPSVNTSNILKCINSIKRQTKKPGQTIIVFDKKKNFQNKDNIIFSHTNKSNQVLQRNHGLRMIKKNIKLILQLDDKFILHNKAIEDLIKDWNNLPKNVAGIGIKSDLKYENIHSFKFLKKITLTGSTKPGKVLKSGFNNKLICEKNYSEVDWLQGGLSSWRINSVPNIFERKFPLIKWSILEDLIFSYDVKFNKNYKLIMSNSLKAKVINKSIKTFNSSEYFNRGFDNAKMHKIFVYINPKYLSKIAFYYSYIASSILGILWCSFKIQKKIFFYFGRLFGIFADIKKIKVL